MTAGIALPKTRGRDAREYLESHGLVPRIPTIRSSDEGIIECPFMYYLTRRLGLGSALRWSEALNRGTWAHTRFEVINRDPDFAASYIRSKLVERTDELRAICKQLDISSEKALRIVDREKQDALTATAWVNASTHYRNPASNQLALGWTHAFKAKHWHFAASECRVVIKHDDYPKTPLVAQYDWLLLNLDTNTLWLPDLKTTSKIPYQLAQVFPIDFQTNHYITIAHNALASGQLQAEFDLPSDVKLGGMIHIIIQKPTIEFGQKDRRYHWTAQSTKKKVVVKEGRAVPFNDGWTVSAVDLVEKTQHVTAETPLTEQEAVATLNEYVGVKPKKDYTGEADPLFYEQRCINWYLGVGDYEHERANRMAGETAPVMISTTPASDVLALANHAEYNRRLKRIYDLATAEPEPGNFVRTRGGMETLHGLSNFAPFFVAPVRDWPTIVERHNFIQAFRDEDLISEVA